MSLGTTKPSPHRLGGVAPVAMLGVVAIGASLPLLRNHIFYLWDDTAGAGLPNWLRMAEAMTHGDLPLLELDMWRGGNFAAEGVGGMWNPVVVAVAVGTYQIDNLAIAITLAKTFFMLVMAGGAYLVARGYGVRPTLAATLGAMLPLAGYTLFVNGTAWVNALILTALTPWLWWAARRALHRGGSLVWVVVTGYLCCSLGNPYGLLSSGFILLGVLVEAWVLGKRDKIIGLASSGAAVLLLSVLVYLPLLLTSSVGYRAGSRTLNDEFLSPGLSDIALMSTPSAQPFIHTFGLPYLTVPGLYLAWFVLPLVPWLRWRTLAARWRSLVAIFVFGGVHLLLMLGPSQVWMFRWPLRLVDSLWLAVGLLFVILANAGLHRDRVRARVAGSLAIVATGMYLAWSDMPGQLHRHAIAAVVVLALVALVIRFDVVGMAGYGVLAVGTLVVLALQLSWFPGFHNVINYQFPNSRALLAERFDKYDGLTVQLADIHRVDPQDLVPDRAYRDLLFANLYSVAGVESTTAYSGIGYTRFDMALCAVYQGSSVCPEAWQSLWLVPPGHSGPLADLIRAQTVVVQNNLIDTRDLPAPDGWRRATEDEHSGLATVWKRIAPLPFPAGRLSDSPAGTRIIDDHLVADVGEKVVFHREDATSPASLTFARLAWPGYSATLDGRQLSVRPGYAGLLVVDLPSGVSDGQVELTWTPPGSSVSIAAFGVGVVLTIGLGVVPWYRRRRTATAPAENNRPTHETAADLDGMPELVNAGGSTEGGVRS